jgi:transcriptional regulator with XRE-family HTH domain
MAARLTQVELAAKLGKAQPMISGAESGAARV